MLNQISIIGFIENMSFIAPLLLFLLMPVGFIASAWVTNSISSYFRPDIDELTTTDSVGTFLLLVAIFASYCYVVVGLFIE